MKRESRTYPGSTKLADLCAEAGVDAAALAAVADIPLPHAELILDGSLRMPMWPLLSGRALQIAAMLDIGGVAVTVDELWSMVAVDRAFKVESQGSDDDAKKSSAVLR